MTEMYFSQLGGCKSKTTVLSDLGTGESPLPSSVQIAVFSLCPHTVAGVRQPCGLLLRGAQITLVIRSPPNMSN